MRLWVNGELRDAGEGLSLLGYLSALGIEPAKVAVELNREIVPKSQYGETLLRAEDRLEIVQFVGGG